MEPVTIIALVGLALSATGAGVGMYAQNKAQRAQDAARASELYRQAQYSKKAGAVVDQEIDAGSSTKALPAIDEAATARAAAYNRITARAQPAREITKTVTSPYGAAVAQQSSLADQWNKILGGAQARMGGFQDWGLDRNIAQQRAAADISLIGRNARGSASVSAAEQQDASRAGDGLAMAGTLLDSAGKVVSAYGATQAGPASETVDPYENAAWGQDDWSIPQTLPQNGYGYGGY